MPADLLSQLLSTNAPPTTQEAAFFQERMDHVKEEIEEIEGQAGALECIGAMEDQVNELRSQIPALKNCLDQYKSILSPCRQIPLEVLGEAFAYLADESRAEVFAQTLARLCQVCKRWRDAAFFVPKLWSQVSVSVAARGFSYDALNAWLSRSRHIPRSLYLYSYPGCGATRCRGGEHCQFSNPDIAKLLKQGPPLDAFTIACQTPECFENFAALLQETEGEGTHDSWSSLRSLAILADGWDYWAHFDTSAFLFIPPNVTSLSLRLPSGDIIRERGYEVDLPSEVLGRLTSLELKCDWRMDCTFKLLQQCLSLESLTATFGYMDSQWLNSPFIFDLLAAGRLVLPNLRRCTLHELTSREYIGPNALACLKLPSLVELEMSFGQDDGDGWCFLRDGGGHFINSFFGERIADFLRGSKSTLQQVTIARVCFVDDGLFAILKDLPALTDLTLRDVAFGAEFFEKVSPREYLPKLHNFNIYGHVVTTDDSEQCQLVRDFAKSRAGIGHLGGCQVCDLLSRRPLPLLDANFDRITCRGKAITPAWSWNLSRLPSMQLERGGWLGSQGCIQKMDSPTMAANLADHPFLAQLKILKEAFDRVQDELHRNSAKLQSHFHQASSEHDRIHELELENKLLKDEIAALRQTRHPSMLPQSHPAVSQVQQLTLSLRKLSDQLTHTEASLLTRTTELTHARSDLSKAKIQEEKAYELAARIRGREEALSAQVQEMRWKVKEATEREKMAEMVIGEYANLVRKLEGRLPHGTSAGAALEDGISQGRLGLKRLMGEMQEEISTLQVQVQVLQVEKEAVEGRVEALTKATEVDRAAKAQAEFELEKMKVDDKTAAKMVSRYMKFSQTQTDSLQTSISSIQTRHSATLSTLHSQIYNLTNQLQASQASLSRFQNALEELNGDIMKEAYGRRNEVALRIKMLGREERVSEALGRWVRKSEDAYSRLTNDDEPQKLRALVTTLTEEAKALLASLNLPLVLPTEDGDVEGSASIGRLVTAEYLVEDMKEELKREVALRLKMGKVAAETGLEPATEDEVDAEPDSHAPEQHPGDVPPQVNGNPPTEAQPVSPKLPPAAAPAEEQPPSPPPPPSKSASPPPPPAVEALSPRAREASDLLSELEPLELEALDAQRPSVDQSTILQVPESVEQLASPQPPQTAKGTSHDAVASSAIDAIPATQAVLTTPEMKNAGASEPVEEDEEDGPATPIAPTIPIPGLSLKPEIVVHNEVEQPSILLQAEDLEPPSSPSPPEVTNSVDQAASAEPQSSVPHNRPPPLPLDERTHEPPAQPQFDDCRVETNIEPEEEEHPLIARLTETAQRYDAIQRSFRDCHLALQSLKSSLPSLYPTSSSYTPPIPREVLGAVIERLDDFVEDVKVEIEIRKGDESVLAKGFEVILKIPGAVPASGVIANASSIPSSIPSAGIKSSGPLSGFNSPLHSTLSLLNLASPRVPNSPLPGPASIAATGMTIEEIEEQIEAFVDGTEPSVRKAVDGFRKKLEDVEHDVAKVKMVVFDPDSTTNGSTSPPLHLDGVPTSVSQPAPLAETGLQSSNGLLYPSPRHPPPASTSSSNPSSSSWTSWIRNASSPLSPPPRAVSPAEPLTFGNIMTSPRLRHSPSLTGSLRRPSSATPPASTPPTISPDKNDVLGSLGLKVPMPKFTFAPKRGDGKGSGESAKTPAQLSASRARTISTLGMGALGGVGGLRTASVSSMRLGGGVSMRHSSSAASVGSNGGNGSSLAASPLAKSTPGNSQVPESRKKGGYLERDIDGDTDIEMDSEAETDMETDTETEAGGSDSDFD